MLKLVFAVFVVVSIAFCDQTKADIFPGTPCNGTHDECKDSKDGGLKCEDGKTCNCPGGQVFSFTDNTCRLKEGEDCTGAVDEKIVENAFCDTATTQKVKCSVGFDVVPSSRKCFKSYAETRIPCGRNEECNEDQVLECVSRSGGSVCDCPGNSIFDISKQQCRYKTGGSCTNVVNQLLPQLRCPAGTNCQDANLKGEKLCSYIQHDKPCSTNVTEGLKCDSEKSFLICDDSSKCVCDGEFDDKQKTWYSKETNRCELLINQACSNNATAQRCSGNSDCLDNFCACTPNTQAPSFDGKKCYGLKDQPCSNETTRYAECSPEAFLTCGSRNKCECKSENAEDVWYDTETNNCRLAVKSACEKGENKQQCVRNADCVRANGKRTCECNAGFQENSEGNCVLPYGTPCTESENLCDTAGYQTCKEKKCVCEDPNNQVYQNGVCRVKVDKSCSGSVPCVSSAICQGDTKTCKCVGELQDNGNGQCVIPHEKPCGLQGSLGECDSLNFLKCIDNTCQCSDPESMEFKKGKCVTTLLNAPCSASSAECDEDLYACVANQCKCNSDPVKKLVPRNGSCAVTLFGKCDANDLTLPVCNPDEFLTCLGNSCQCDQDHPLKNVGNVQKCVAVGSSSCITDTDCEADKNFVCGETKSCVCKEGYELNLRGVCDGAGIFGLSVALMGVTLMVVIKNLVGA